MKNHDTLCGWGDRAKVAWFVENAETIIPCMLPQASGCSQNRRRRGRSKNP